jgi:hypothetical protein
MRGARHLRTLKVERIVDATGRMAALARRQGASLERDGDLIGLAALVADAPVGAMQHRFRSIEWSRSSYPTPSICRVRHLPGETL